VSVRCDGFYLPSASTMSTFPAEPACSPTLVTIRTHGGMAYVSPSLPDILRPILSYDDVTFHRDSHHRLQITHIREAVCALQGDALLIPIGCISRVVRRLNQLGYQTRIEDRRDFRDAPCSFNHYATESDSIAPGLASRLSRHAEGLIESSSEERTTDLLGVMCWLFHPLKVFIACKTVSESQTLASGLGRFLGGEVSAVRGWNWSSPCRVVCGTFQSLDRSDPADWQVLIFANAFEAIQSATHSARNEYRHRRIYAVVDPTRSRSLREELMFETLAGPVIYRDSARQHRSPPELMAAFANHSSRANQLFEDARERRISCWHDTARNQAIVDVASSLVAQETSELEEHGLFLDDEQAISLLNSSPGVIILVDSADHGDQLRRLLPAWQFFESRTNESQTAGRTRLNPWGVPRNSIVTVVAARNQLNIDGQVLIWASAGKVPFVPSQLFKSARPRLVVDFWDDGNSQLAADTLMRLNAFRTSKLRILGHLEQQEQGLKLQIDSDLARRHQNTSRRRRRSHC